MSVGKARSRLGLQLVARQVLRPELEGVGQVGIEIGGGLARDPVDEVERDVVKSGITKMVEGTPDGVRLDNTVEDIQEMGRKLCTPSEIRFTPWRRNMRASSCVTVSGFASTVTSFAGGRAVSRRSSAWGSVKVGVPPPRNTVSSSGARTPRSSSSSASSAST